MCLPWSKLDQESPKSTCKKSKLQRGNAKNAQIDSGSSARKGVGVRLPSSAPLRKGRKNSPVNGDSGDGFWDSCTKPGQSCSRLCDGDCAQTGTCCPLVKCTRGWRAERMRRQHVFLSRSVRGNVLLRGGRVPMPRDRGSQATMRKSRPSRRPWARSCSRMNSRAPRLPTAPRMKHSAAGGRASGASTGRPEMCWPILDGATSQ